MKIIFILFTLFCTHSYADVEFMRLFKNTKPIIAAIMVPNTLSTPAEQQTTQAWVEEQARIATLAHVDGLLLEFRGGGIMDNDIPASQVEAMATLTKNVASKYPGLVMGVEILWHYPGSTLLLAKQSGAKFVRLDFFSDRVIADGREVPIDPKALQEYRKKIGAESIALLTDIQVKYSKMVNPKITITQSAKNAIVEGSNGVIVSGTKSGSSPDTKKIIAARKGSPRTPLIIGSGFSLENAPKILPYVDAVIVGTSISEKTGGPLLASKTQALMDYVKKTRGSRSQEALSIRTTTGLTL